MFQRWKPHLKLKVIWKHNSENYFFGFLEQLSGKNVEQYLYMCQLRNRINSMAIQSFYFPGIQGQFVILGYVNMKDLTGTISRLCLLYSIEVTVILISIDWTIKEILAYFTCCTSIKTKIICFPLQVVTNDVDNHNFMLLTLFSHRVFLHCQHQSVSKIILIIIFYCSLIIPIKPAPHQCFLKLFEL